MFTLASAGPERVGGNDLEDRARDDLRERVSQWIADEEERGPVDRTAAELAVEGFSLLVSAVAVMALELPRATDAIFERLDAIAGKMPS